MKFKDYSKKLNIIIQISKKSDALVVSITECKELCKKIK